MTHLGCKCFSTILCVLGFVHLISGYPSYQDKIPNGEQVPHPCKPNYVWHGVGHHNPLGGGNRNMFGKDFRAAGRRWTKELCQKDSDNDGLTNGQELGDPNCTWSQGMPASQTTGLSHPGVCTPRNSSKCAGKDTWVTCETGEFVCNATKEPDMKNITIRFPPTPVPNTETNYYCQVFDVPSDKDYHMVATQPLIDNKQVMHHIILYGCDEGRQATSTPQPCNMAVQGCFHILGGWTVGQSGECLPDHIGFRIGNSSYKTVAMEFHWNNPELSSDYTDSSGMVLYYTDNMRTYDAGTLTVGQIYLEIPPGKESHIEAAVCPSDCTRQTFKKKFQVVAATNHMHYLGRSANLQQFRNGTKVRDLAYDEIFSYDLPVIHAFDTLVEIEPGDEIRMSCNYKSTNKRTTVYYGDGTSNEMCFGFVTYYPADALYSRYCTSWKSVSFCEMYYTGQKDGCNWWEFWGARERMITDVLTHCKVQGPCGSECFRVVEPLQRHVCLKGDIGDYLRYRLREEPSGHQFVTIVDNCVISASSIFQPNLTFMALMCFTLLSILG